jgi:hypothetical protein
MDRFALGHGSGFGNMNFIELALIYMPESVWRYCPLVQLFGYRAWSPEYAVRRRDLANSATGQNYVRCSWVSPQERRGEVPALSPMNLLATGPV